MNITPQVPNLSIPTVLNPHTESLRRENNQREIITKPAATNQSAAEKGVASDKERGKTPAQNNAHIDFASITEQAELANTSIAEQNEKQEQEQSPDQKNASAQEAKEQAISGDEEQTSSQALEQARVINELKKRDLEVRAHESAHASVGGSVTGAPNLSYEKGPDGKRYAVEGDVAVDLSTVQNDPRATIAKMQKVHAAALAPIDPSRQDIRVASTATQKILQAQSELFEELSNEITGSAAGSDRESDEKGLASESLNSNDTSSSSRFDTLINQTLASQDKVAPTQSEEIVKRSARIENFYSDITQAYEKPPSFKFELTA